MAASRLPAGHRRQLYPFLDRHLGLDTDDDDLPFEDERLTEEQLRVGLPPDNATLHSLARDRLVALRRQRARRPPPTPAAARRRLRRVLRLPDYGRATGRAHGTAVRRRGRTVESHVLSVGPWSLPATVVTPDGARGTEIALADMGRAAAPQSGLEAGRRLIAVDLLATGECRGATFQQAMLLAEIDLPDLRRLSAPVPVVENGRGPL